MIGLEKGGSFALLVSTDFKVLAPLNSMLGNMFATLALQPQHNLLCRFSLLVENGLSLATITGLLAIITTLSLGS